MSILIKGGDVDLFMSDGSTIDIPTNYGLVHDEDGTSLDRCSLFIGPFEDLGPFKNDLPDDASQYFGNDYDARTAEIDVPDGKWELVGQVAEILYYRPGRYEDDWHHEFSEPVDLFEQAGWYMLKLPNDCQVNWRGIVKP